MAESKFDVGEWVKWDNGGGTAEGLIVRFATRSGRIGDFVYAASENDPRYVVETNDGKRAAPKAETLKRA